MTEFYSPEWYDKRWADVPLIMKKVGVTVIKRSISEGDFALIRAKHKEHGRDWIRHAS